MSSLKSTTAANIPQLLLNFESFDEYSLIEVKSKLPIKIEVRNDAMESLCVETVVSQSLFSNSK